MTIVRVTDHAVIRYLERARGLDLGGWQDRGVDVERVRAALAAVAEGPAAAGASAVVIDSVRLMLKATDYGPIAVTALRRAW